ncbi:MAG TPA: glycine--tRNA ligase subunit beta [Desulfobulbaceae bacterium]|nr:glycine--tRNA ligase subunit beta [Desulfobulbaceae bacterium]
MSELLFEIGTEEIPAGYIQPALNAMAKAATSRFADLALAHGQIETLGTPRRLTLVVCDLQQQQADLVVEHTGPSRQAGFDGEGNPSKAALGFARSRGVDVQDLKVVATAKGEYLMAVEHVRGRRAAELLPEVLAGLVRDIPFPKSMRWGQGSITFARPIQWLLVLLDGQAVPLSIDNISSGATTWGHRFMAPRPLTVSCLADYLTQLRDNYVLVDQAERRAAVVAEVQQAVARWAGEPGATPLLDEGLVDTVTNLVEIPWGVCGSFDTKFLELPGEVLITSMREHQKYFPVAGSDGRLLPRFVAINNTRIDDRDLAVNGHQRVLRARLEDALFFFREDKKRKLADRREGLAGIVFQNKLGTMLAKSERVARLARLLAERIAPASVASVTRAAELAKCDLLTAMVGEFPTLQGIMGRQYALADGEPVEVANAIFEHYKPVRAGGELPEQIVGAIVGMADRIDTLAGCFAIGEKPTGTTDPFGLRRQALGLLHIILGHKLHLSLADLTRGALAGYQGDIDMVPDAAEQMLEFIRLRFENDRIAAGQRPEVVAAAVAAGFDDAVDCLARILALEAIRTREEFAVLAGSFKRIRNIIKDNKQIAIDENLLAGDEEKNLFVTLRSVQRQTEPLLQNLRYEEALAAMLQMKEPVDRFFDKVMVMTDDPAVRQNRLNLLTALGEVVLQVGDISRMHQGPLV